LLARHHIYFTGVAVAFDRTTMKISSLVERVDNREILLPEIQRDYVWKSHQIAKLLDSLYRQYPSGSLLLWETAEEVVEREVRSRVGGKSTYRPLYLLDGQQRLTSLHRVFNGDSAAEVVFNVVDERFQLASAATRKDHRWVGVHEILNGKVKLSDLSTLVEQLHGAVDLDTLNGRINRVTKIAEYEYHVETIRGLPYVEVTDIFVRVNSRGKNLTRSDLALSTLTAKYPGFYDKLRARADTNAADGYRSLGVSTLVRALAVFGTPTGTLEGLAAASTTDIDAGWVVVERGAAHLLRLLKQNLDLGNDGLLPSANALIPLVGYLGRRQREALPTEEADALIYWLLVALLTGRYSGSVDTKLAQDRIALSSDDAIRRLFGNIGLTGRYRLGPDSLVGRSTDSAAFMLMFLAARKAGAHDWWTAAKIGLVGTGEFRIEYHHIHPQATIKKAFSKPQVNDVANLAFISEAANKRISNRSPAVYFPEVGDDELARHFIPLEMELRSAKQYLDFLAARRVLLVRAMNDLLDGYAPSWLAPSGEVATGLPRVTLQVFSDVDAEHGTLRISYEDVAASWEGDLLVAKLIAALDEVADGIATQLDVAAGVAIPVDVDEGIIAMQTGPIRLEGTLEEWRRVVERELGTATPMSDAGSARGWVVDEIVTPVSFAVLGCE
jgi:hypothetical protein